MKGNDYKKYVLFQKDYDDLTDDFSAQSQKVLPFSWFSQETLKPTFAQWTGGSLGGVSVAPFSASPLDDYFTSIFGMRWLSRQGASAYEVDDTGLIIPSIAVSPFLPIPQMYYDKWNHLWHDILGSVYDPLNNVDRYEYTEYGKIFGGTNDTVKQDAVRTNTTVSSGSDSLVTSGTDTTSSSGTDTVALTGTDTVASSGTDSTGVTGTDTTTRTGSQSTSGTTTYNNVTDTKSGGISRTYNALTDTSKFSNSDETVVSAYNTSTYSNSNKVTHETIGNGDTKVTSGGYTDADTTANVKSGNVGDSSTVTFNSVADALNHNTTSATTYGKSDSTTYGRNTGTTYGKSDSTTYGKTDTTNFGKTDTTTMSGGELHRVHGNIGVTKTTELLDAEIEFRIWRFYRMVMDDIAKIMFLNTY